MTPRKEVPVFFVLDTSGSVSSCRVSLLNRFMGAVFSELAQISENCADARMKIAVLSFNTRVTWADLGGDTQPWMEDAVWNGVPVGGLSCLGEALKELNRKLNRGEMLAAPADIRRPILFFFLDGWPNDDWLPELEALQKNPWYGEAVKCAFAMSGDTDCDVLARLVGNPEAVFRVKDPEYYLDPISYLPMIIKAVLGGDPSCDCLLEPEEGQEPDFGSDWA